MKKEIVFYLRVSKEDTDLHEVEKEQSNSIVNQHNLLLNFVSKQDDLKKGNITTLIDDGYSGTNQNRPNFQRLLEMAKKMKFDVLIVKDFSRFARDHILLCDYIDQIFPFLGIRMISVNDHFDGAKMDGKTLGIDVGFRSIVYAYYSQDLSQKTKTAKRARAKQGKNVNGKPPFGYKKDIDHNYVIEPKAAEVVKYIFALAFKGMPLADVARKLNQEKIPTKSMIKLETIGETRTVLNEGRNFWTYSEVYRIIHDRQYLGKLIYGKSSKVSVSERKTVIQDPKDWVVIENAHEPLVTQEVFDTIQEQIPRKGRYERGKQNYLFTGKIKCGVCRHALTRMGNTLPYYRCAYSNNKIESACKDGKIYEEPLCEIILDSLLKLIKAYVNLEEVQMSCKKSFNDDNIYLYKEALKKSKQKKMFLYESWIDEAITTEIYEKKKSALDLQEQDLIKAIEKGEEEKKP